jgi:hypothetical protein
MNTLRFSLLLSLLSSFAWASSAIARPLRYQAPALPPPPDLGTLRTQGGGGQRGCNSTVLVPKVSISAGKEQATTQWGITTASHPSFWLYLTSTTAPGATAELTLHQMDNQIVQRVSVPLPSSLVDQTASNRLKADPQRIVALKATTMAKPLQPNQVYRWQVKVFCDPGELDSGEATADFVVMQGGVQRIAPSPQLQQQLAIAQTPLEKASLYASQGIWFDALTLLGKQAQTSQTIPSDLATAWADLLRQANLPQTRSSPILNCCSALPSKPNRPFSAR